MGTYDDMRLASIPGWFAPEDIFLFQWWLADQRRRGLTGDLVEIGAYLGKSAVVVGDALGPGETFTVVDLFGAPAGDTENQRESDEQYAALTRTQFEANYLRFHDQLPVVVQDLSSSVTDRVQPGTVRFMHVDGSHLYTHVRGDAQAARELLKPEGVVVFDDFRSPHTPGTAAAVWEAVLTAGLNPVVLSGLKLYGSWGPVDEARERLLHDLEAGEWNHEVQEIAGHSVVRIFGSTRSTPQKVVRRLRRELVARAPQRLQPRRR